MANKMAEFPGKLAIFWQKAASLREAARGGVSPENLKTQGGGFWKFSISGGYFGYTPPPLLTPGLMLSSRGLLG